MNLLANYGFSHSRSLPMRSSSGKAMFAIIAYLDGFGYMPIHGSGELFKNFAWEQGANARQQGKRIDDSVYSGPIRLCTEAEHREFLRQCFPATFEHTLEQENLALESACL